MIALSPAQQYAVITANYWSFTLTDGALRMLVVLYFHQLGYTPLEIAFLFLFYELFGVITNLTGGWLGARLGLNRTMQLGLALQLVALAMLLVPTALHSIPLVMLAQALSGVAKDLNKMSAKSAVKLLVPREATGRLFRLVAFLTGSKNALKGVGYFLGGALLAGLGFRGAILAMLIALSIVWLLSFLFLKQDMGKTATPPAFSSLLSKSSPINRLSAARFFLFGARDVWFVVALPLYLTSSLQWNPAEVSGFMALWIIGYGIVQAVAPHMTGTARVAEPPISLLWRWAALLLVVTIAISGVADGTGDANAYGLLVGLMVFAVVFAVNSSLHSFFVVRMAAREGVSLDIGFYYMANAGGRLVGTLLSGWLTLVAGLNACLMVSALFLLMATVVSWKLPTLAPD